MPEPSALVGVLLSGGLYWRGVRILWLRAGRNHVISAWQAACFGGGLLTVVVALESPLDGLSTELFAAHMVQHLLLLVVAGPLVVLGAPLVPMLWALPESSRRVLGAWLLRASSLGRPGVAFALHSLALWAWHLPSLYEAALRSRGVHILEHVSFLGTAVLFWWAVVYGARVGHRSGVVYVFGLALESSILGALLAFSPTAWYAAHATTTGAWGMTPLDDQQVAGLIMWVPGGSVYLAAALGLFATLLRDTRRRAT
ncbi:MAG: cytochrome c oxidase assembly protein [Chloroflexota bacterium]|nr:cytochrome c oxidase assembly protein [Chloroflexota bacterium]